MPSKNEWQEAYSVYLQSPGWKERRNLVLKRANYTCEGCGMFRAVHVHHKTYETYNKYGFELLWELVAVCDVCHDVAHGRLTKSQQQPDLIASLCSLSPEDEAICRQLEAAEKRGDIAEVNRILCEVTERRRQQRSAS